MKSRCIGLLFATWTLGGCAILPQFNKPTEPVPDYTPVMPEAPLKHNVSHTGSLFSTNTARELFTDTKAFRVGDVITVKLVERTNAKTQTATSASKDSSADFPGPIVLGRPVTVGGAEIFRASAAQKRAFSGSGNSSQSNQLSGEITVTVAQVLPNGNLHVRGQKQVRINESSEFMRISGIVRPQDVAPDNTVASTKVANAQVQYGNRGVMKDVNKAGWLTRFFSSPYWPF